jgi:hypothetical protein
MLRRLFIMPVIGFSLLICDSSDSRKLPFSHAVCDSVSLWCLAGRILFAAKATGERCYGIATD